LIQSIRKRTTFSNVIALIALFAALGGTAFAASKIAKNSVGSKQLKNNAVTGKKIKKDAVTGDKVKDGSLSGADINLGSLGQVPSAASAGNSDTVNGQKITKFLVKIPSGATNQQVFSIGGFTLTASCTGAGGNVNNLILDTTSVTTEVSAWVAGTPGGSYFIRNSGSEPNSINLSEDGATDNDRGIVTFTAAESSGNPVLTGTLSYDDPGTFGSETTCAVWGHVISG
jgi:hypothetical protein